MEVVGAKSFAAWQRVSFESIGSLAAGLSGNLDHGRALVGYFYCGVMLVDKTTPILRFSSVSKKRQFGWHPD